MIFFVLSPSDPLINLKSGVIKELLVHIKFEIWLRHLSVQKSSSYSYKPFISPYETGVLTTLSHGIFLASKRFNGTKKEQKEGFPSDHNNFLALVDQYR